MQHQMDHDQLHDVLASGKYISCINMYSGDNMITVPPGAA